MEVDDMISYHDLVTAEKAFDVKPDVATALWAVRGVKKQRRAEPATRRWLQHL